MPHIHQPYIRAVSTAMQDSGLRVADYSCYGDPRHGQLMEAEMRITAGTWPEPAAAAELRWTAEDGWSLQPLNPSPGGAPRLMETRFLSRELLPGPRAIAGETRAVLTGRQEAPVHRVRFRSRQATDGFAARLVRDYPLQTDDPADFPGRGLLPPDERLSAIPQRFESPETSQLAIVRLTHDDGTSALICEAWPDTRQWRAYGVVGPETGGPEDAHWHWCEIPLGDYERAGFRRDLSWNPVPVWQTTVRGMWGHRVRSLADDQQAAAALAEFPAWAERLGLAGSEEDTQTARDMVLSRFPHTAGTIEAGQSAVTAGPGSSATSAEPRSTAAEPAGVAEPPTGDGREPGVTEETAAAHQAIPSGAVILDQADITELADLCREADDAMSDAGSNDAEHDILRALRDRLDKILQAREPEPVPDTPGSRALPGPAAAPTPGDPGSSGRLARTGHPGRRPSRPEADQGRTR